MGTKLTDAYSLLHFAVGVLARHWALGFWTFFALHTLFEIVENTGPGMHFINTYISAWPGGKPYADSIINRIGDTIYSILGWLLADYLLATSA